MIKPEDIRIGDLVRTNRDCAFPKDTKCVVTDTRTGKTLKDKKGIVILSAIYDDDDGPWGAWCCYIEGIPLTSEFLEKNGFKGGSSIKRKALRNGTTSIITTSALISCTRSQKISLLPTLTAKS